MLKEREKERIIASPPDLPPFLTPKRRGRGEWIIMPDIVGGETATRTQENNTWTYHYVWMVRMHTETGQIQRAHVNTRLYKSWLETYEMWDNIPPHIQFGGAVEAGESDPEFYNKWIKYAQETFC